MRDAKWLLAGITAALIAPFAVYPIFLMKGLCFGLFAVAFNLLLGYTGLLSFGHAAFFGFAAYVAGHALKAWGTTPEVAILAGVAVATLMGLAFGLLAIRRLGIYFAMVTLALAQMLYFFCLQAPFTHGEDGIQAIPRGRLFGLLPIDDMYVLYYVVLAIFTAGVWIVWRTIHSPFGQVLKAIRENEPRAISLGYETARFKLAAFVLSAALTGLAGATKALVFQLASLTDVDWHTSGEVVLMTLLGGMGTPLGPVVGAFVIITVENYLADIGAWVTIIQGSIFILVVTLFRRGLVSEAQALFARLRRPPESAALVLAHGPANAISTEGVAAKEPQMGKSAYQREMKRRIQDMSFAMDRIRRRLDDGTLDNRTKVELMAQLSGLEMRREQMDRKLEALQAEPENTWTGLKAQIEEEWNGLVQDFEERVGNLQ